MKSNETKVWVKKAQRHDKDAFTELMQFYMKDMYRTAIAILMNEEDAADALQDTILTCWEKLYTLRKPEFFKTWMTRILINHCYDIIRHNSVYENIESYEEPSKCDNMLPVPSYPLQPLSLWYLAVMTTILRFPSS